MRGKLQVVLVLTALLILPSCGLLFGGGIPNPLPVGGIGPFEPGRPGIFPNVPPTMVSGQKVGILADASGAPTEIRWNFGGGADPNISMESLPVITPLAPGTYHGNVVVSNQYGQQDVPFTYTVTPAPAP